MGIDSTARQYDVALSFAGEDRGYVDAVAHALREKGLRVFYDRFEEADLLGRNLVDHLSDIYQSKARLCVVFISAAYARKPFPKLERQAAQSRAIESDEPYIIPVRLDDTHISGLLPTIAFTSGKTPQGLAQLIASRLLLTEPGGYRPQDTNASANSLLLRFTSLIEPDMNALHEGVKLFSHWSEERIGLIPIELRLPAPVLAEVAYAKDFRSSKQWESSYLSDAAREQFTNFYDQRLHAFLDETIKCLQLLFQAYWSSKADRLPTVVRRFLMARMTVLCRLIFDLRLVGMSPARWQDMFAHFAHSWSEWIMYGLPYASFLDGDEHLLWIDVDGRDTSSIQWPKPRFRLYAPAELLCQQSFDRLNTDQFDRFFATQFVFEELDAGAGRPLQYFAQYPDRLDITIRGEWAFDTDHFVQHGTSNFGGRPLLASVHKLRDYALNSLPKGQHSMFVEQIALDRVRSLFRDRDLFDEVLQNKDT